jgi:TRAP-type C4-dicarboxylate transport system permease small subunit
MTVAPDRAVRPESPRIPQRTWIGLVVVAVYVLIAAGLGNLMDVLIPTDDPTAELAASHFIPLAIGILLLLVFVRWSGWSEVWTNRSTLRDRPRRWWLLAIPVLMVLIALSVAGLISAALEDRRARKARAAAAALA